MTPASLNVVVNLSVQVLLFYLLEKKFGPVVKQSLLLAVITPCVQVSMEQESANTVLQACQNVLDCASKITQSWDPENAQHGSLHADLTTLSLHAEHGIALLRQSQAEFKAETSATAEKAEALAGKPSSNKMSFKQAGRRALQNFAWNLGAQIFAHSAKCIKYYFGHIYLSNCHCSSINACVGHVSVLKARGRELLQQLEALQAYQKQGRDSSSLYTFFSRMQCYPATNQAQTTMRNFTSAQATFFQIDPQL